MPKREADHVDRIVEQWRRELPRLPLRAMGLVARLGLLARLGERLIEAELMRFGLKLGEFDVLSALRRAGAPFEVTPTELYRSLMLSSGAMTNRLDHLEEAGLVQRKDDPDDRRGYRVGLTGKGKQLIDRVIVAHVENEERLVAALSSAEQDQLDGLLRKLLASAPSPGAAS
jgi:DNA-binding MarR family transcriptional regulator